MIATDNPELFSNVQELNITPSYREENSVSNQQNINLLLVALFRSAIKAWLQPCANCDCVKYYYAGMVWRTGRKTA